MEGLVRLVVRFEGHVLGVGLRGTLSSNARVDDAFKVFGRWLPVEAKLDIDGERDLSGQ